MNSPYHTMSPMSRAIWLLARLGTENLKEVAAKVEGVVEAQSALAANEPTREEQTRRKDNS